MAIKKSNIYTYMRISKNLPQFHNQKALIIVSGVQEAEFYIASEGIITKLKAFRIPRRRYSDKEGFSISRSRRGTFGSSGSVREHPKQALLQDFIHRFKKEINEIDRKSNITSTFLLSSAHMINIVQKAFPPSLKKKLLIVARGNYCGRHPFELLKKIQLKIRKEI